MIFAVKKSFQIPKITRSSTGRTRCRLCVLLTRNFLKEEKLGRKKCLKRKNGYIEGDRSRVERKRGEKVEKGHQLHRRSLSVIFISSDDEGRRRILRVVVIPQTDLKQ